VKKSQTKSAAASKTPKPATAAKTAAPSAPVDLPAAVQDAQSAAMPDIYASTIALALDKSKFGNRRKVSLAKVEVDADKAMLSMSKRLLQSPELKAINAIDSEASEFLSDLTVPAFFKPGIHLVPLKLVAKVDAKLTDLKARRQVAVDEFVKVYPTAIEEMRTVLREMFNPADYPSAEELRRQFAFSWRYLNLGAPQALQSVSAKLFNEQRDQIAAQVNEAAVEIRNMLRGTMAELVNHMVDRLTPDADGKPKMFRDTLVERFNTFLENFELRNVTNDAELQKLVAEAKNLTKGVDADVLRNDEARREQVVKGIEAIKSSLSGMVVKGGRVFDLDDDAAPFIPMSAAAKAAATRARSKAVA
jgi:hypothetical protein